MRFPISYQALEDARVHFEDCGTRGLEGTAMLAGRPEVGITRCFVPDQIGRRTRFGVSVEVTEQGKLQLAGALRKHERWMARIHSHPGEAFHSDTDDDNPGLTAEGALSIVVPFFGLGLSRGLEACAIYVYRNGQWISVSDDPEAPELRVARP